MGWGLWCDVMKRKAHLILVLYLRGYFPADDFCENRLSHCSPSSFFVISVWELWVWPILLSASQRLRESRNAPRFFLQALAQQVIEKLAHPEVQDPYCSHQCQPEDEMLECLQLYQSRG
jgi:hypothetical protein